jgi:hypothetical protein
MSTWARVLGEADPSPPPHPRPLSHRGERGEMSAGRLRPRYTKRQYSTKRHERPTEAAVREARRRPSTDNPATQKKPLAPCGRGVGVRGRPSTDKTATKRRATNGSGRSRNSTTPINRQSRDTKKAPRPLWERGWGEGSPVLRQDRNKKGATNGSGRSRDRTMHVTRQTCDTKNYFAGPRRGWTQAHSTSPMA